MEIVVWFIQYQEKNLRFNHVCLSVGGNTWESLIVGLDNMVSSFLYDCSYGSSFLYQLSFLCSKNIWLGYLPNENLQGTHFLG